jgi:hypothetical protein
MPASSGFSITIRAVDQTTATLDKINSKIASAQGAINRRLETANAPLKRLQAQMSRTVNLLGGGKLAKGVVDVSKGFALLTRASYGAFENISRIVDPLKIIGSVGTVAGIAALESRFASLGQTLTNTSKLMNMDPARLAQWEGAVKLTGGSAGDADSSLRNLQYAANDARFGQNNYAAGMLKTIEGPDWEKKSQDINGTTMAISKYLQTLEGAPRANAIRNIQGYFGFSDGFMAMLLRGPAAVQKLLSEAKAHGSPTDGQIGMGDSLAHSLNAAQESVEGLATAISSKLTPILQPIIDRFSKWVDANRNLIGQRIGDVISGIATKIASINLKPLEAIADRINSIVQKIGGWQNVLIGVIGVLTAAKVASIAVPFVQLAGAISGLTSGPGSFGALGRALTAAGFAVAGGEIVRLAGEAAGAGQTASTIAGDAVTGAIAGGAMFGPIGAGIGGALGAGYGLYAAHKQTSAQEDARADDMTSYFRSQGLSAVQAAALVGGFQQESSLDPTATNGNHYGIGQWDPARQADFRKMFGHDIQQSTLQEQMQFALNELFNGKEAAAGKALLASKTAVEATEAALSYERPATPGSPAWQNERAWRLQKAAAILARQPDGGKYLPQIDPAGNAGPWPPDNEPSRLLGVTQPGTGMDPESRGAPNVAPDAHAGEYRSALTGQWVPDGPVPGGQNNTSVVDIHVHDHRVTAQVRKQAKTVLTKVAAAMPLPAGAP